MMAQENVVRDEVIPPPDLIARLFLKRAIYIPWSRPRLWGKTRSSSDGGLLKRISKHGQEE